MADTLLTDSPSRGTLSALIRPDRGDARGAAVIVQYVDGGIYRTALCSVLI